MIWSTARGLLRAQQTLIVIKQGAVDLDDVVFPLLDVKADDQIKFAAVGQGVTGPADEIVGLLQIQFQRQRQGKGRGLGGLVLRIAADLGEVLLGETGFFVNFRILPDPVRAPAIGKVPWPCGRSSR